MIETKTNENRMHARTPLTPDIEQELQSLAEQEGCELIHAEFKGGTLRLVLDRPDAENGVTISDCETISRQASALLDVAEFGDRRYTLEVSSPGLDRQLYRPRDYERFQGRLARVTFRDPADDKKKTLVGRLTEFRPSEGQVVLTSEQPDATTIIPLEAILLTRLEIEL